MIILKMLFFIFSIPNLASAGCSVCVLFQDLLGSDFQARKQVIPTHIPGFVVCMAGYAFI